MSLDVTQSAPCRTFTLACVLACSLGCGDGKAGTRARPSAPSEQPLGYAPGPWWRGDLNQTVLGAAHILISYRGAAREERLIWIGEVPVERTRQQALALAHELARRLQRDPVAFAELARRYSDDPTTAEFSGDLGPTFAPHLPGPLVDALGNVAVGEISRVVETSLGFHLVRRQRVPPEQSVAAEEIVLGYDGALPVRRLDRAVNRSRADARLLADALASELREDPTRFPEFVARYSDSVSADQGGDYGVWSNYARYGEPLALARIAELRVGEVSRPVGTRTGFRIFKRTEPGRAAVAASLFAVGYSTDDPRVPQPAAARTREQARALAEEVARLLARDGGRFDALREKYCDFELCRRPPLRIKAGDATFGLLAVRLSSISVEALLAGFVELPGKFVFARRLPLELVVTSPEEQPTLDLPRPPAPTLETATAAQLVWYIELLRQSATPNLALTVEQASALDDVLNALSQGYASAEPAQRQALWSDTAGELQLILGPEKTRMLSEINDALLARILGKVDP